jgi:PTH1 family peptidyl-tRNA hydrolase
VKVVCGLGNPGPEYESTRHNVGWWLLDRLLQEWRFEEYRRRGAALVSQGQVGDHAVVLLKPLTYMNRSGVALLSLRDEPEFDPTTDLLVVVDDTALPVGRLRFRAKGSAGGHNGLKSVEAALGSREYPRLRIGVGEKQPGEDLADHVLSEFEPDDEARVVELLPHAVDGVRAWLDHGVARAARYNR